MDPSPATARQLRRVRTLGRGASGAVVWLASDDASGQLLAVKSAGAGGAAAAQLRREGRVLEGLSSPHIVPCLGSRSSATGGEYQLFLEFAPGGSLADEAAHRGGRLEEHDIRGYARDVARGLAYLHGRSLVHGDVKPRNVVIGGDGRARLTDFGCARPVVSSSPSSRPMIGGTPAFMAPEVARGEEQGPAADVWALACTVIEMATGRAPWSGDGDVVDDVFAAVHKIGYTDAVPELPACLSTQGKNFLRVCLARNPRSRPTAAQLLEHPFLASACGDGDGNGDAEPAKHDWPSPNSTLNAAFWEFDNEEDEASDSEDEEGEASERAVERISSLASPCSGLPDWDYSEEGWIEVRSECSWVVSKAPAAMATAGADFARRNEALDAAVVEEGACRFPRCNVGVRDGFVKCQRHSTVGAGGDVVGAFGDYVRCQKDSRVSLGSNAGVADDGLVKCGQIHPRVSIGSSVGIADDFARHHRHSRVSNAPDSHPQFPSIFFFSRSEFLLRLQENSVPTMVMMKQLKRVRTLGRGASGAVVWLATDEASGELLAVKSARAASAAAQLRREGRVLEGLSSPHIVPCLGARAAAGGEYQLLLEFAPGGSLADEAGRLDERDVAAYAADVARGLAYLHGRSLVHGDVKAQNVVIGGDGRARLTDFGCARPVDDSTRPIGGTPAFMAPEVARGEEQGPAADVWALGCTVVEMATGRAPWSDMDAGDLLAVLHRIGYTDAVPEVPASLSPEAKDFLACCFKRNAGDRSTAAQLLAHPFVAGAGAAACGVDAPPAKQEFPSPKSTLHDAFWDSDTDEDEAEEMSTGAAERIGALACAASALPDWDSDEGWIDLQDDHSQTAPPATTETTAAEVADYFVWAEPSDAEVFDQFFATEADISDHLNLPGIAVAAVADFTATISQGSYLISTMHLSVRENEIPGTFNHEEIKKVAFHRPCNRNRITTKRISLQISAFAVTWLADPVQLMCVGLTLRSLNSLREMGIG
ncbi:hypothetical protein HU200_047077 [Digitaria exilis]|uniref:Protein kinase domain-containing protein n=1 Tax=Digitaria exilis TaxID=1010633 RepID=A0A835ED52_9POAL|nr:hypothetical protein HU200_047077 [Digitaria exilis]